MNVITVVHGLEAVKHLHAQLQDLFQGEALFAEVEQFLEVRAQNAHNTDRELSFDAEVIYLGESDLAFQVLNNFGLVSQLWRAGVLFFELDSHLVVGLHVFSLVNLAEGPLAELLTDLPLASNS